MRRENSHFRGSLDCLRSSLYGTTDERRAFFSGERSLHRSHKTPWLTHEMRLRSRLTFLVQVIQPIGLQCIHTPR